jgi:N6-L-threonylcarbamoyladenine synthase
MIAYAGLQRLKSGVQQELTFKAKPRWPLDTLAPVDC